MEIKNKKSYVRLPQNPSGKLPLYLWSECAESHLKNEMQKVCTNENYLLKVEMVCSCLL
jgi:hypothetical protein